MAVLLASFMCLQFVYISIFTVVRLGFNCGEAISRIPEALKTYEPINIKWWFLSFSYETH